MQNAEPDKKQREGIELLNLLNVVSLIIGICANAVLVADSWVNKRKRKVILTPLVIIMAIGFSFWFWNDAITAKENVGILLLIETIIVAVWYIYVLREDRNKNKEECATLQGKHDALLNLYHEGKVHTINYVLGLEDLEKGSCGNAKKQTLEATDIEFTFTIDNRKENMSGSCANVEYLHTLRLRNQSARQQLHADFLILHAYGGLDNVRFLFDGKQKSGIIKAVPERISRIPVNQRLARCSATPDWNPNHGVGKLEFGYKIYGEHNMTNTLESFVIIPKNYAKSIEAGMEFRIDYMEDPTKTNGNVGIELRKLSMEASTPNMELVGNANVENGGKGYTCGVPREKVDMTCIYFLLINYDKPYSPDTKEAS